jgi:hypothetical protein
VDYHTEFCNLFESPDVKNILLSKDTVLFEQALSTINSNTKKLMQYAFIRGTQIGEQAAKQAMLEYLNSSVPSKENEVEIVPSEVYADLL